VVRQLDWNNFEKFEKAKAALQKLGPKSVPIVTGLLNDPDLSQNAMQALVVLGEASIPTLNEMLRGKDSTKRLKATSILIDMPSARCKWNRSGVLDTLAAGKEYCRNLVASGLSFAT
jgi:hypothetical protein